MIIKNVDSEWYRDGDTKNFFSIVPKILCDFVVKPSVIKIVIP